MGFRFWRRIRLFLGLTLDLSKNGVSASLGVKGVHVTVGSSGTRTTVGLPGTAVSCTNYQPDQAHEQEAQAVTINEINETWAKACTSLGNTIEEYIANHLKELKLSGVDRESLCGLRYFNKIATTAYDSADQLEHERFDELLAISDEVDVIVDRYLDPAAKKIKRVIREAREKGGGE